MFERNGTNESRAALVQWVRYKYPRYYQQIVRDSGAGMGDISDAIGKFFTTITTGLSTLAPAYLQTRAEIELLKLNIQRAKQGQSPVNSLPQAADSGSAGTLTTASGNGLPSWAIPAGIGIVLLLFLMRR